MMTAIQVRAKRAEHDGRAWHTVELVPANSEKRATWSAELAAALSRVRLRFPTTHYEHRTRSQNPDDHHHIPAETVRLGQVLDLVTQLGPIRTTWDTELAGWQLLTDADAMRRRAGHARLYLVKGALRTPNPRDAFEAGHSVIRALRRAVKTPASDRDLATMQATAAGRARILSAINRLEDGHASIEDLDELATLADFAGLDWAELFPEWLEHRQRHDNPAEIGEHAADTYERWHQRAPRFVGEIDELPDLIGVYIGRALRIGYRSDKWGSEGATHDYDHDFSERGHTPPEAWADSADLAQARAIVIVGGDMRVTPEGID